MDRFVDPMPVPAPVQQHAGLGAGLQIMLLPRNEFECEPPAIPKRRDEEKRVPDEQRDSASQKRPLKVCILTNGGEETERGKSDREGEREAKWPEPRAGRLRGH